MRPNIEEMCKAATKARVFDYVCKYMKLLTPKEQEICRQYGWKIALHILTFPEDRILLKDVSTSHQTQFLMHFSAGLTVDEIRFFFPMDGFSKTLQR